MHLNYIKETTSIYYVFITIRIGVCIRCVIWCAKSEDRRFNVAGLLYHLCSGGTLGGCKEDAGRRVFGSKAEFTDLLGQYQTPESIMVVV